MQEISIIGRVEGIADEAWMSGKRLLRFSVRAENSPADRDRTSSVFTVLSSKIALRERLTPGTDIYVTGLLSVKGQAATVQALLIHILEQREKTAEEVSMEMFASCIPLQDI